MATYADIAVSVIFVLAILIGVIRGFARQFSKGLCGLIGLVISAGLTVLILPAVHAAGMLNGLAGTATGWFTGEQFTASVASHEQLLEVLSSGILSILSGLAPRIWSTMESAQMTTLGAYFGDMCARLIVGVAIWIVLLLLIKLVFFGIRKLLKKLASLPVLHTLDKIFGAIWSFAIAYIIVVCIIITAAEIVIIKWLPNFQPMLDEIVNQSKVFQFVHGTNIFGSYIAQMLGVDLATLSPIV